MLLTRTLQHLRLDSCSPTEAAGARNSSGDGGAGGGGRRSADGGGSDSSSTGGDALVNGSGLSRRELAVQLLLFLQLLEHWVIAEAVKAGEEGTCSCC